MFVNSLANDIINDETPWQKLNDGKQPFLRGVTTLLCCFGQCCWGCIHSPASIVLVLK